VGERTQHLNNQTREYVEEAQKNKELRDKYNNEVQSLKDERNRINDEANALFEEIEAFKKSTAGSRTGASKNSRNRSNTWSSGSRQRSSRQTRRGN